jgi:glycosyltransferase involved in cell wall biosynthesis
LGKRIFLDGRVNNSQISDYYKRASILVNPSLSEAFGMSLVEAMMYRVPVVASRVGGMTNIVVDGQTGRLVSPADPDGLATAICDLLANRDQADRMGDAGRQRALEKYSWDRTTDLLLHYFRARPA